jgi:hypothetical protein
MHIQVANAFFQKEDIFHQVFIIHNYKHSFLAQTANLCGFGTSKNSMGKMRFRIAFSFDKVQKPYQSKP